MLSCRAKHLRAEDTPLKISKRLQKINQMITKHYDHIWDCCCDHGLLGQTLLNKSAAGTVHFVDIVEPLMRDLQQHLENTSASNQHWKVHCIDVANIPLPADCRLKNLIIIAGVGGDLLIQLVQSILDKHPNRELEFLLCPVHHNYKVRQALIQLGLGLIDESLVHDNKRFYEVIYVSTSSNKSLSPVGSLMWDFARKEDNEYLRKTVAHYQRMNQKHDPKTSQIIHEYSALVNSL